MSGLALRPAAECEWDLLALGEVMLRLDPGEDRVHTARTFRVWEGGGEYNVARGLRRCFGLRTGIVTALADNAVGRLVEDLVLQGGVEPAALVWRPYDGIGRSVRNGLNFTERGFGVRAAAGCSDRGHTAVSQLTPGEIDWDDLLGRRGARWLHCGGIFAGLSESTAAVAEEAMRAARRHGTMVSFDLNYRPSLWQGIGGPARAAAVNRALVGHVDVLLGNEEDFSAALGYAPPGDLLALDTAAYERLLRTVLDGTPGLRVVASTLRQARTASRNDWSAVAHDRERFARGPAVANLEILDRVGGGDSFASGLFYGLLGGEGLETALAYGVAHGALAMTTPGDTSTASLAEVRRVMGGGGARVQR